MTVCIDQFGLRDADDDGSNLDASDVCVSMDDSGGQDCPVPFLTVPLERTEGRGTLSERRIQVVLEAIERSLESGMTGDQLAATVGLSKGAFHRAFRATFGTTPFRYLTRRRIEAAAALMLQTELPLGAIAVQCGFYDQAHLCRQFRKAFGESPMHWRQRHPRRHWKPHASA